MKNKIGKKNQSNKHWLRNICWAQKFKNETVYLKYYGMNVFVFIKKESIFTLFRHFELKKPKWLMNQR
jgi:hypothetical protein